MRIMIRRVAAAAGLVVLAACQNKEILDVPNLNNPDVARTYSTPAGVESVISSVFRQAWGAEVVCTSCISTQAHNMALENYSELNNFSMNIRSIVPRGPIGNERNGAATSDNYAAFRDLSKAARSAANGLAALERLVASSTALPANALGSVGQDARARSFGYFSLGWALSGLALAYDSAAIVTNDTPSDAVPGLSDYKVVGAAAMKMLDSALAWATAASATGAGGFPLPSTWINGNAMTAPQFAALIRTQRARLRAGIARTPAERAAVDWNAVVADAQAGIASDFIITMSVSAGWSGATPYDTNQMNIQGWHSLTNLMMGMADTSGAYATFIATPFSSRDGTFLIRTPDQRFPQGATRAAQQADTPTPLNAPRYVPGAGYGSSQYDYRRWAPINASSGNGPWVQIPRAELDMLIAEAKIRSGDFAGAAALIDAQRAKHGLPSIGAIASASQAIAGGSACVPRVPQAPSFGTMACGTIMEAMKWEKRLETMYSCAYLCWFTDSRGWGDLPEGTANQWPVPYQEMDARVQPYYGMSGSTAKGTYGW